jgi:hypothetical protein
VAGEAFTKLRYDRRISGRRDARAALAMFAMLEAAPDLFNIRGMPDQAYERARALLAQYVDQSFSYVDAIVLLTADDDRSAHRLFTVDSSMATHRFYHAVIVDVPGR